MKTAWPVRLWCWSKIPKQFLRADIESAPAQPSLWCPQGRIPYAPVTAPGRLIYNPGKEARRANKTSTRQ